MIKKLAILIAGAALTIGLGGAVAAHAQLFPYNGSSTALSSSVVDASTTASSTASMTTPTATPSSTMTATSTAATTTSVAPTTVTAPSTVQTGPVGEYLQIDGLTVTSVSATTVANGPVTILATNTSTIMPATTAAVVCTQFATDSSPVGIGTACPVPPTTASSSAPYSINVNGATQLLLDDRSPATLSDIMPGDTINVYGYYTDDGSMDAEIVRDTSASVTSMGTGGSGSASVSTGTAVSSTAELQSELNQLEALVLQLETELGVNVTSTTSATSCPMIPAGSTSTAGCPPASSTTTSTTSSTIYE